jgi:hypothetical protein
MRAVLLFFSSSSIPSIHIVFSFFFATYLPSPPPIH